MPTFVSPDFVSPDFDSLVKLFLVSSSPRDNASIFNMVGNVVATARVINHFFGSVYDDFYGVVRPAVVLDSSYSESFLLPDSVCFDVFNESFFLSLLIDDDYSICLSDWTSFYHCLLKLACSSDTLFRCLSPHDISYLDDACFPWYLDRKGVSI